LSGFAKGEFERIVKVQRDASYTLFGDAIGDDKLGQPVSQTEADALVTQLRMHADATAAGMSRAESAARAGPVPGAPKTIDSVAQMEDYVHYLEDQMSSVGDDAQLANVDLQNCLQRQQQTLQLMSNIGKILHDVSMAIIRNTNT
jgi:hypothetical protein